MLVDKSTKTMATAHSLLEDISRSELPTHCHPCPHCGLAVRYPAVARVGDLEDFAELMESAQAVLERHGYTGKILSEVMAECHIRIAQNISNKGGA